MDTFNPYSEWLELDPTTTQPNYYELFGLDPFEGDEKKITAAADRAMSKVRACRPGPQAARWAQVLDELDSAKDCLVDVSRKQKYDEQLRKSGTYGQTQANTSTAAAPIP